MILGKARTFPIWVEHTGFDVVAPQPPSSFGPRPHPLLAKVEGSPRAFSKLGQVLPGSNPIKTYSVFFALCARQQTQSVRKLNRASFRSLHVVCGSRATVFEPGPVPKVLARQRYPSGPLDGQARASLNRSIETGIGAFGVFGRSTTGRTICTLASSSTPRFNQSVQSRWGKYAASWR